jgi:hypothetical protein
MDKSLKNIKNIISYLHTKIQEYVFSCILGFNNLFIKL